MESWHEGKVMVSCLPFDDKLVEGKQKKVHIRNDEW